jgi:UDPglucose--hexose-1-phosphate uridylyltransferase
MPTLRKDPVTDRWVIISPQRAKKPVDIGQVRARIEPGEGQPKFCPFCPGNESATPPEVLSYRRTGSKPNEEGWTLRVTPNKFPALRIEGNLDRAGEGVYDKMNGIGAHEVIIETPDHYGRLTLMDLERFEDVIWAFRDRMIDLKKDKRFKYILIFKNQGSEAGASLEHTHSQLIALPIVPQMVNEELEGAKRYFRYKERCIFCDIVRQELSDGSRIVSVNDDFVALEPFAPRFPFETWILPRQHDSHFEDIKKRETENLARIFQDTLKRIMKALNWTAYNFMLHSSPFDDMVREYYHWHFEIIPKSTKVAGFEWGSGFFINHTAPEDAAAYLRDVDLTGIK